MTVETTQAAGHLTTVLVAVITATPTSAIGILIGAWVQRRRTRADIRLAEVQAEVTENDSRDAWWERRVRVLTEHMIDPLRIEVTRLRQEVEWVRTELEKEKAGRREEVAELRAEVDEARRRYRRAVTHIRALVQWAGRLGHSPDSMPAPPPEISADI